MELTVAMNKDLASLSDGRFDKVNGTAKARDAQGSQYQEEDDETIISGRKAYSSKKDMIRCCCREKQIQVS